MTCHNTELHDRKGVGWYRSSVCHEGIVPKIGESLESCDIEETLRVGETKRLSEKFEEEYLYLGISLEK